eukprot:218102-Lingulodinium_polyedra.AAC.1
MPRGRPRRGGGHRMPNARRRTRALELPTITLPRWGFPGASLRPHLPAPAAAPAAVALLRASPRRAAPTRGR